MMKRVLLAAALAGIVAAAPAPQATNPVVVMETSMGTIKIELYPEKAPVTVKNFLGYGDDKFYDDTIFHRVLGKERTRWFQPYKSWMEYTTIGGGSDHMLKFDSLQSTNPWNPWLGIEVALTRKLESGLVLVPEERLSREEALRLYTINNAFLGREEKDKGNLVVGKLADMIMIDRDYLTCPVETVSKTQVLTTIVGGKVVYERKE